MFGKWQAITLWKRVLIGLVVGMALGLGMRAGLGEETATGFANSAIKPFGDAFVRLIKMLIIPLISTTLVVGVTAMGDPKKLGTLGARTPGAGSDRLGALACSRARSGYDSPRRPRAAQRRR